MQVGIILPMAEADGAGAGRWMRIRDLARHAEAGGIDSLWVYDHLIFRLGEEPEDGIHEAFTVLAALAAVTERARLGSIVFATSFRSPAVFAKMLATADEISGGRLIAGLGCGWHEPEYRAFGIPFDNRVGRFEEALAVMLPLLRGERVTIAGRWTTVDDAVLIPPPPRPARMPGRIPILVAAARDRMLRLTARHADAWNTAWYGLPDERFAKRHAALLAACEAEGRDPATLELTVGVTVEDAGDAARPGAPNALAAEAGSIARALDAWRAIGTGHVILDLRPADERMIDIALDAVRQHRGG